MNQGTERLELLDLARSDVGVARGRGNVPRRFLAGILMRHSAGAVALAEVFLPVGMLARPAVGALVVRPAPSELVLPL